VGADRIKQYQRSRNDGGLSGGDEMSDSLKYWQDLAVANRKVAEAAQAQRDKAVEMLRFMRDEYASLPHSLGYTFTHLPKIDDFLKECGNG
jgi:hypothetical protein